MELGVKIFVVVTYWNLAMGWLFLRQSTGNRAKALLEDAHGAPPFERYFCSTFLMR